MFRQGPAKENGSVVLHIPDAQRRPQAHLPEALQQQEYIREGKEERHPANDRDSQHCATEATPSAQVGNVIKVFDHGTSWGNPGLVIGRLNSGISTSGCVADSLLHLRIHADSRPDKIHRDWRPWHRRRPAWDQRGHCRVVSQHGEMNRRTYQHGVTDGYRDPALGHAHILRTNAHAHLVASLNLFSTNPLDHAMTPDQRSPDRHDSHALHHSRDWYPHKPGDKRRRGLS